MWRIKLLPTILLALLGVSAASAAGAQLIPQNPLGGVLGGVGRTVDGALGSVERTVASTTRQAMLLASERLERLRALVRASPDLLELTTEGPAVRGEIIAVDPDEEVLKRAAAAGFRILADETIEGLNIRSVTFQAPRGLSIARALLQLRTIAPGGDFTANHLHLPSGATSVSANSSLAQGSGAAAIGIIDGGVAAHPSLGSVEQRGFAAGAPAPSSHGTAVASLAVGDGPVRGSAPGASLLVADVYGRDPRGGNAVAIAQAIGFMVERRVKVIGMSLVGPPNPLVAKAIGQAMARGTHVVAAVGNDGPAAPPAFPASYKGVISVTGVDRRERALPEAGRALHVDFAAPGADMAAAAPGGRLQPVRGTSFSVPLVAGRLASSSVASLRNSAKDLGPRGFDQTYGHGLICGECRTPIKK